MRAWQITRNFSIEDLALNTLAEPSPGPGQIVVAVKAVSLNFRDLLITRGLYSKKVPLPLTICSDAAGVVALVGAGVTRVKPGDRVAGLFMPAWIGGEVNEAKARSALGAFAQGVLAEGVVFSEEAVVKVPDHLNWEEAATLPCAALTAWNALVVEGNIKAGDTVLVQGTGGVSIAALQIARICGANVIATTSRDEKAKRLKELGAEHVINYNSTQDWDEQARKLTGGVGVDHVVEIGGAATMNKSIRAVRIGGRISLIGNRAAGHSDVNLTGALMKAVRIQGIFVGSREMFEAMNRALALHHVSPVVDRVFEMDEARAALGYLDSGAHFGKVVIRV